MSMSADLHFASVAEHVRLDGCDNDALKFRSGSNLVNVFVPPHVAKATAAAFNRAMQVQTDASGLMYATEAGSWHVNEPMPGLWHGQFEEVTGDGDPSWMFAEAPSLEALQDLIDDIIAEEGCTKCSALVGDRDLTELSADEHLCGDCLDVAAKHAAGMAEMAGDDKAHAYAEREAGL
jgi:hypothetical protein